MTTLADHWSGLAAAALLGSDRHRPPELPSGIVADLAAERPDRDTAEGLLDQVALLSAVRRAGIRPNAAAAPLLTCPADPRPECRPAAVARLEHLLAEWPHLVDEWLARFALGGWALPAELAVVLLARFRADPERRAVVAGLAGELASWLAELFPDELAPRKAPAKAGVATPDLPLPDEVARLSTLPPGELAVTLAGALARGQLANRHRAPLVRFVSAVPFGDLAPLADALARAATNPDTMGLVLTLADLAQTRLDLIRELAP